MCDDPAIHGDTGELFERAQLPPESAAFLTHKQLICELQRVAEAGWADAAVYLGEELARPGPNRDVETAYKWFHIGYAWSDYKTAWHNDNGESDVYTGVVGDFRNETIVAELIDEIPRERIHELDAEAVTWLSGHTRQEYL